MSPGTSTAFGPAPAAPAPAPAPATATATAAGPVTQVRVIRAEWTKLRALRSTWWCGLIAVVPAVPVAATAATGGAPSPGHGTARPRDAPSGRRQRLTLGGSREVGPLRG
jgi:hypothetical protein